MAERKAFNNFVNSLKGIFFNKPVKEIDKPYINPPAKRVKKKAMNRRAYKAQVRDLIIHGKPKYYKHI